MPEIVKNQVVTPRQSQVLTFIEDQIGRGFASPNTVEIARHCQFSTGEVARILDALEHFGFITRLRGVRRNIRLCQPAVKQASDSQLIDEMTRRGYFIRKPPCQKP